MLEVEQPPVLTHMAVERGYQAQARDAERAATAAAETRQRADAQRQADADRAAARDAAAVRDAEAAARAPGSASPAAGAGQQTRAAEDAQRVEAQRVEAQREAERQRIERERVAEAQRQQNEATAAAAVGAVAATAELASALGAAFGLSGFTMSSSDRTFESLDGFGITGRFVYVNAGLMSASYTNDSIADQDNSSYVPTEEIGFYFQGGLARDLKVSDGLSFGPTIDYTAGETVYASLRAVTGGVTARFGGLRVQLHSLVLDSGASALGGGLYFGL